MAEARKPFNLHKPGAALLSLDPESLPHTFYSSHHQAQHTMPLITPAMRRAPPQPPTSSPAVGSSSTATLGPQSLPPLLTIPLTPETLGKIKEPVKRIASEEDVEKWKQSTSYSTYLLFLQRVAEACVGKYARLPPPPSPSSTATNPFEKLIQLLHELNSWTDNIEPQAKPQRFGNLAFRDWGQRLSDRIDRLHEELLPERLHAFVPELKGYLGDAWGSFTRIDYGSGHELAFFAWVGFLYRLGFFTEMGKGEEEGETIADEAVEERIGLEIFPLYLLVVWRLQDRYGLEPAGSHGVWGLDDFQFLPYVLGAAQLRTQSSLRPSQIVPLSSHPSILNGQLGSKRDPERLISAPLTLPTSLLVEGGERVVIPNLYLTSLLRIQVLKRGPFHEHSPLLHDIATTVPNWVKVYGGMVKMYCAECLGKKVVVQHFPFGGTGYVWEDRPIVVNAGVALEVGGAGGGGGRGMALGGTRGNMGSMGIPTARVTTTLRGGIGGLPGSMCPGRIPGGGGEGRRDGALGHALGLGPRVGRGGLGTMPATRAPGVQTSAVPPLRTRAPAASPSSAQATSSDEGKVDDEGKQDS